MNMSSLAPQLEQNSRGTSNYHDTCVNLAMDASHLCAVPKGSLGKGWDRLGVEENPVEEIEADGRGIDLR